MLHALLETFPLSHPKRRAVEKSFGVGSFSRIEYQRYGPIGRCYWNVDDHVKRHGGEVVHGWLILTWPGLYVQGHHHAVWRTTSGSVVDITEKRANDRRNFSTFCVDESFYPDRKIPSFVPNKYYKLSSASEVQRLVEIEIAQLDHNRILLRDFIKAGATWDPNNGLGYPSSLTDRFKSEIRKAKDFSVLLGAAYDACAALERRRR